MLDLDRGSGGFYSYARRLPRGEAMRIQRTIKAALALVIVAAVALAYASHRLSARLDDGLRRVIAQRGRVVVVGDPELSGRSPKGSELLDAGSLDAVSAALGSDDVDRLRQALALADARGLLVATAGEDARGDHLAARFARYEHVPGFKGRYLTPTHAFYLPDDIRALSELHKQATARVARGMLAGARPPRVPSFPEPLRRVRHVEVMVLLRHGQVPRLWRSSRGSSIARALLTAASVARRRWQERVQAMGGPLDEHLDSLDVEVSLLEEDGTLGARDPAFIDRVFQPVHGVGYRRKGAWRYLLPRATRAAGDGSAARAYEKLLEDNGLPPDALQLSELRLYRLVVVPLATSPAPNAPSPGAVEPETDVADGGTRGQARAP